MTQATPSARIDHARPDARDLFSDPVASALWTALLQVDVALQHEFLAKLRERLAVPAAHGGPYTIRMQRLVASVREAHELLTVEASRLADTFHTDDTGGLASRERVVLTEEAYMTLRAQHRERDWVPASTMRSWVQGSWNDVLRRARLDTVAGGDVVVRQSGGALSWEEVRAALRGFADWRAAKGLPADAFGMSDYLSWVKLPAVQTLAGRRPQSQGPFDRFGGFLAAKAAALSSPDAPCPDGKLQGARSGVRSPTSGYCYTHEELKAAVDEVVRFLKRVPTASEFRSVRRAILEDEAARGVPPRPFPSYMKLIRTWAPWDAVLVACGHAPLRPLNVDEETGQGTYETPEWSIPEADVLAGVREAFEAKGKPFTVNAYSAYVKERCGVARTGRRLVSYGCIYSRYRHASKSPWKHVCALAMPTGWDAR